MWVGAGGSGWEWVGVGGSKWEWMGVDGSESENVLVQPLTRLRLGSSHIYVNISLDITSEIMLVRYVHLFCKSKVRNVIFYATKVTSTFGQLF